MISMIIKTFPNCKFKRDYESEESIPEYLDTEENQESKFKR